MFGKLNHVGIFVKDRDASIEFYTKVLGGRLLYKVDAEPPDGEFIAMIEMNGYSIEVLEPRRDTDKVYAAGMGTNNHFGIEVDDIDAAVAYMEEKGYPILEPGIYDVPGFGKEGRDLRVAFFRGPDGERIELFYQNMEF